MTTARTLQCEDVRALLPNLLDECIHDPEQRGRLEGHLLVCEECALAFAALVDERPASGPLDSPTWPSGLELPSVALYESFLATQRETAACLSQEAVAAFAQSLVRLRPEQDEHYAHCPRCRAHVQSYDERMSSRDRYWAKTLSSTWLPLADVASDPGVPGSPYATVAVIDLGPGREGKEVFITLLDRPALSRDGRIVVHLQVPVHQLASEQNGRFVLDILFAASAQVIGTVPLESHTEYEFDVALPDTVLPEEVRQALRDIPQEAIPVPLTFNTLAFQIRRGQEGLASEAEARGASLAAGPQGMVAAQARRGWRPKVFGWLVRSPHPKKRILM